ncbi:MAG: type II toxin-antitoxin system RelE/ParE family toxin [Bacteroidetes bacterium]|nr:type II toxin-antitoxin system RelE/ParE family toxin [Bacteroidota bacterium]
MYKIIFTKTAKKQLEKLSNVYLLRVERKLKELKENPFNVSNVKKLEGEDTMYRLRIADIRIVYNLDTKRILIEIIEIIKRNDAYKKR